MMEATAIDWEAVAADLADANYSVSWSIRPPGDRVPAFALLTDAAPVCVPRAAQKAQPCVVAAISCTTSRSGKVKPALALMAETVT